MNILQKLLENENLKLSIDVKDSCGVTPLMDALATNHVEIAKVLIEKYQVTIQSKSS
jgi:hypothetical protein